MSKLPGKSRGCDQRSEFRWEIDSGRTPCLVQSINQSTNQSISQSVNQPINQPSNQPINRSINQPINQSTNQSTKQSINQPTNQMTQWKRSSSGDWMTEIVLALCVFCLQVVCELVLTFCDSLYVASTVFEATAEAFSPGCSGAVIMIVVETSTGVKYKFHCYFLFVFPAISSLYG